MAEQSTGWAGGSPSQSDGRTLPTSPISPTHSHSRPHLPASAPKVKEVQSTGWAGGYRHIRPHLLGKANPVKVKWSRVGRAAFRHTQPPPLPPALRKKRWSPPSLPPLYQPCKMPRSVGQLPSCSSRRPKGQAFAARWLRRRQKAERVGRPQSPSRPSAHLCAGGAARSCKEAQWKAVSRNVLAIF